MYNLQEGHTVLFWVSGANTANVLDTLSVRIFVKLNSIYVRVNNCFFSEHEYISLCFAVRVYRR